MSFTNLMREMGDDTRGIGNRRFQGWVVNNDDSTDKNKNQQQVQRVKVRIADLHDNLKDEDLPWFSPGNLPSYSGGAGTGDHGPIPPVGTKVWVEFEGDSQYHGVYTGAVQVQGNKIPDFTGKGRYAGSYPAAQGSVDASGSLTAVDSKYDTLEETHVSGTSRQIDGQGNVMHVINGNNQRQDNPNAKAMFPKGFNVMSFGGINLWASDQFVINCRGVINIAAMGDTNVTAKGKMNVYAGSDVNVSALGKATVTSASDAQLSSTSGVVNISSTQKIALNAPVITTSVIPVIAAGASPAATSIPPGVAQGNVPTPRSRPNQTNTGSQKAESTSDSASLADNSDSPPPNASTNNTVADPSTSQASVTGQDQQAMTMLRAQAQASLIASGSSSVTLNTNLPSGTAYSYTVNRDA